MTTLIELINSTRAAGISSPKVRTEKFKFSYAKNRGRIYVTDHGPYGNNEYFGFISLDNDFWPHFRGQNPVILAEVTAIIKDIGPAMKAYGRVTGSCCICGRLLVNKTSIKYSIGPICAGKVGMPLSYFEEHEDKQSAITLEDI